MKKLSLIVLVLALAMSLFASCGEQDATPTTEASVTTTADPAVGEEIGEGQYSFDFTAVFADGTAKHYRVNTDCEIAGDALLELELIAGEESAYGLFVKSVCGVTADYSVDQTFWALYVDGESSMVGIDSVESADASRIEFKVEK